jgi:hypothetical protein
MTSEDIKVQPEVRWRRRIFAIAIVLFLASTAWNVGTRINVQKGTAASIDQVITTVEDACKSRHALTVQYQVRAKNQRVLASVLLLTTGALLTAIDEGPSPPPSTSPAELEIRAKFLHRYRAAIPKLKHILATTRIFPLEDCHRQARELRADLPAG